MHLLTMMDELLRNRDTLYRTARDGGNIAVLCRRLLLLFLISSALYGAVMGAYRSIHPDFFFSDFELIPITGQPLQGDVAGMASNTRSIYTRESLPPLTPGMQVRFNRTDPSEAFAVQSFGVEKGYNKIVLVPGVPFAEHNRWLQPALVALKIPLLFLLTLLVCAFALYIVNLAVGMQLHFSASMLLMLFALAGTGVLLVVFTPIALLFTVVTTSYHFMKIMHVLIFIVAGLFGVKILAEGLTAMQAMPNEAANNTDDALPPTPPRFPDGDIRPLAVPRTLANTHRVRVVLFSWLLLYCLVGAQLAWTLKPFLGTPYLPATPPFRLEQGNIFVSTIESFQGIHSSDREKQ